MQTFNIDISRKNAPLVLYAKQGDSLSRFFKIVFLQDGVPWEPPAGALFSVRFGAPSMPDGWYDTIKEQDGSTHSAFSLKDNALTVELAYEAVSMAGTNTLAVLVLDANGYQLGAWNLHLDVELTPGENSPEADVYYSLLSEQVAQVLQAKDDAQASAILSQSWAVGGTSSRAGEDTNNSMYWAQQAQQSAQESLGFRTFFSAVRPDLNGDLDPSSPMFAGTGASITVRSGANRIENVTSHGSTEQAGTGDASPTNVRPITVGGLKLVEKVLNGSENWKKSTGVAGNAYYLSVSGIKQNGIIYSQHAKSATQSEVLASKEWKIALGSGFDYIRLSSPLESVSELKSHLKKNPLPAWYQPADESDATGIYTPQISDGESYHCECVELQQHLCEGDTVDSNVPSGCDKSAVFDGSPDEAWGMQASGANTLFYLQGALIGNSKTAVAALSNLYPNTGVWGGNTAEGFSGYDESLYVRDFRYSTAKDFKAALATNPLIVYYRSVEYTTENNEKACIERHVRRYMVVDGATVMFEQGTEGYKVTLKNAQSGAVKCNRFKSLTVASGAVTIPASQFPAEVTNSQQANEWAKTNNVQLEYELASPAIYAQPAVDLPADPITSTTQATLEEPAPDTPMLLAMQGETGTYTVSGEKTVSVYLKPMQNGGDAATLGGNPPEYFLPADQPAVSAPKSSKPTFAVNYGRIVSPDNSGLYLRNADRDGAGIFVGVREDFQSLTPDHNTSGGSSNLGAPSYRWRIGYFVNQPDVSSDQNMKEQIEPLSEKQMLFFDALKPVQYKLKGSSHDRLHYGFIAQEVEQAMAAAGISDMEFGGFCKDRKIQVVRQYSEEGELIGEAEESMDGYEYSLRYGEFIALNTAAIQAMKKEILDLKAEINKLKGV